MSGCWEMADWRVRTVFCSWLHSWLPGQCLVHNRGQLIFVEQREPSLMRCCVAFEKNAGDGVCSEVGDVYAMMPVQVRTVCKG